MVPGSIASKRDLKRISQRYFFSPRLTGAVRSFHSSARSAGGSLSGVAPMTPLLSEHLSPLSRSPSLCSTGWNTCCQIVLRCGAIAGKKGTIRIISIISERPSSNLIALSILCGGSFEIYCERSFRKISTPGAFKYTWCPENISQIHLSHTVSDMAYFSLCCYFISNLLQQLRMIACGDGPYLN